MSRRVCTFASAGSFLLWLATLTLWATALYQESSPSPVRYGIILVTTVVSIAAGAILPFLWLGTHLAEADRRHRLAQGRCSACNYNLQGNTSGVCPECGVPIHSVR